jgi:hypothetical protein
LEAADLEVAEEDANKVAEEVVEEVVSLRRKEKIITNYWVSREMQLHNRSRKLSRKWLSSIILIKIKRTLKEQRRNFKRLQLLTKHYLIHKREKYMMFMEKMVFKIMKVVVVEVE